MDPNEFDDLLKQAERDPEGYRLAIVNMRLHDPERLERFVIWMHERLTSQPGGRKRRRMSSARAMATLDVEAIDRKLAERKKASER